MSATPLQVCSVLPAIRLTWMLSSCSVSMIFPVCLMRQWNKGLNHEFLNQLRSQEEKGCFYYAMTTPDYLLLIGRERTHFIFAQLLVNRTWFRAAELLSAEDGVGPLFWREYFIYNLFCLCQNQIIIPIGTTVTTITEIRNGIVRCSGFCFICTNSITSVADTTIVTMRINLAVRFILFSFLRPVLGGLE